jgi:hypothetical protein
MSTLKDQKLLAFKLLVIQTVGMMVVLATGSFSLLFCRNAHTHDTDPWPLALCFILVSAVSGFFFIVYKIPALLISHAAQLHTEFKSFHFLKAVVWIDLVAMLGLVSFTGGLSDSFYTPILVVIPIVAFLIQEEPDYKFTFTVFIVSFIFIILAAAINGFGIDKWLTRRWLLNPTNQHSYYILYLCVGTIFGAGIPFIDVLVRYYHEQEGEQSDASTKSEGSDVLDKTKYEQKESRKQQLTQTAKRRYIVALLFACIFIASTTILLGGVIGVFHSVSDTSTWVAVFTAVVSAIGTISTTILAWRKDRRDAREEELKISQLEREAEAAGEKPVLPNSKENHK